MKSKVKQINMERKNSWLSQCCTQILQHELYSSFSALASCIHLTFQLDSAFVGLMPFGQSRCLKCLLLPQSTLALSLNEIPEASVLIPIQWGLPKHSRGACFKPSRMLLYGLTILGVKWLCSHVLLPLISQNSCLPNPLHTFPQPPLYDTTDLFINDLILNVSVVFQKLLKEVTQRAW